MTPKEKIESEIRVAEAKLQFLQSQLEEAKKPKVLELHIPSSFQWVDIDQRDAHTYVSGFSARKLGFVSNVQIQSIHDKTWIMAQITSVTEEAPSRQFDGHMPSEITTQVFDPYTGLPIWKTPHKSQTITSAKRHVEHYLVEKGFLDDMVTPRDVE